MEKARAGFGGALWSGEWGEKPIHTNHSVGPQAKFLDQRSDAPVHLIPPCRSEMGEQQETTQPLWACALKGKDTALDIGSADKAGLAFRYVVAV